MTDIVLVMGLFYDVEATAIGNRLVNVGAAPDWLDPVVERAPVGREELRVES